MSMVANHSAAPATAATTSQKSSKKASAPSSGSGQSASKTKHGTKHGTNNNGETSGGNDSASTTGGGIFRPLVVLALPGVNLFRRFSQYKRLPQDPPKDRLEVELERLNNKIVSC